MSSHTTHDRLRAQADRADDPSVRAALNRLADLHELDAERQSLPMGSPERARVEDEIADRAQRILHPRDEPADAEDVPNAS